MQRLMFSVLSILIALPILAADGAFLANRTGPLAGSALAAPTSAPVSAEAGDQHAAKKKRKHRKKKHKSRKPPTPPTCFGRPITIFAVGSATVTGTSADDVILGDGSRNIIQLSNGGTDRVCTGGGDDFISKNQGILLVDAGPDNDNIQAPTAQQGQPSDQNRLLAGPGSDIVFGGGGNDRIFGGDGDDFLNGIEGDDTIFGEAGNDRLRGNAGFDVLDGGADVDSCQQDDTSDIVGC